MRRLTESIPVILCIFTGSAILGLTANALRSDGLPIIRKPLRETRAFIPRKEIVTPEAGKRQTPLKQKEAAKPILIPLRPTEAKPVRIPTGGEQKPRLVAVPEKGKTPAVTPKPLKIQALFTTLADAKSAYDSGKALFLDSRPIEDYQEEHIEKAVSLDVSKQDELIPMVLKSVPKETLIVTYCSDPECREATKLADSLAALGFRRVVILLEGLPGWKKAGYPVRLRDGAE